MTPTPQPATAPNNTSPPSRNVWQRLLRVLLRSVLWLFLLLAVLLLAISLVLKVPAVQNWLLPIANNQLTKALGAEVRIGRIGLDLPDLVVLEDVHMKDNFGKPLLDADRIRVAAITGTWLAFLDKEANERSISIREVELTNPSISLYVRRDTVSNLDFLLKSDKPADTTATPNLILDFGSIRISNMAFRWIDSTSYTPNQRRGAIDYSNVRIDSMDLASSFYMPKGGQFRADVDELRFIERLSGLRINHLETSLALNLDPDVRNRRLAYNPELPSDSIPYIRFTDTKLDVGRNTRLAFTGHFDNETFDGIFQPDNGNHPRTYRVEFEDARMDFADLDHFVPEPLPLQGIMGLDGVLTGDPYRLRGDKVTLTYANNTRLVADLRLTDYTTPRIFMRLLLYPGSQANLQEVDYLLTETELPAELNRLGTASVEGRFTGFYNDFVTNLIVNSRLGRVDADMNLKLLPNQPMIYSGNATTRNLNLDALLGPGSRVSRNLNFSGRINGRGTDIKTANTSFDFTAQASDLVGYQIDTVKGDVQLRNGAIVGTVNLSDRQGSFDGRVDINLNREVPTYFLVGDLENADLHHYGLTNDSIRLTTIFNVNLSGDSLDNLSGYVRLFEINLARLDRRIGTTQLDTTRRQIRDVVVSSRANTARRKNLRIDSELLNLTMNGQFSYQQLGGLLQRLGTEATLWLANDTAKIRTYYAAKTAVHDTVTAAAAITFKRMDPLLSFLRIPLRISPNARLEADMAFGDVEQADIVVRADSLAWDSIRARTVDLDLRMRKPTLTNNLSAEGLLTIDRIRLASGQELTDFEFAPNILNQAARIETRFAADSGRASVRLAALARYADGVIDGRILSQSSGIVLRDSLWRFDPENRIRYGENLLQIENFRLTQGSQSLVVESNVRGAEGRLTAAARNMSVNQLASIFLPGQPLYGVLNATARIGDPFGQRPNIQLNGNIRRLQYDNVRYGDLLLESRMNAEQAGLLATLSLVRQRSDTLLSLRGTYDADRTGSPLDFRLATYNLPIDLVTPFVKGILYDMTGQVNIASLHLTGKLSAPQVRGTASLDNVRFGVDFFKTTYSLNGQLTFTERSIELGQMAVRDANNHPAVLRGTVFHDGFTAIRLDLALRQVQDFLFMNTTIEDNETFYGRAVIRNGSADIRGSFDNLSVNANIRTGAGTHIYIPLSDYQEANRLPYVVFKTTTQDSINLRQRLEGVTGLNLNLTVDATPDAELTLVLDERTGDNIKAAGAGTLAININTAGEFNMYGTYEVTRGSYLMNLQGVLRREFQVAPPSTISWSGDPLQADLNIEGTYTVNADLSRLETGGGASGGGAAVTRPVEVLLYVKGNLLAPQVSFGLRVPNLSSENSLVLTSLLRSIENDPQEMNKQVVSLLLYRQFAPQSSLFASDAGGSTVGSTASELLSGQLNSLLNNVFEGKLQVGVGTNNQFRDVNLNLQANLFNNRLTIERSGGVVGTANRDVSIGNLRIAYRLLPGDSAMRNKVNPGILTVEGFNRENFGYNLSNAVVTTSQGGGLFYRKEFETFADLFRRKRKVETNKPVELPRDAQGRLDTMGIDMHRSVMSRNLNRGTGADSTQRRNRRNRPAGATDSILPIAPNPVPLQTAPRDPQRPQEPVIAPGSVPNTPNKPRDGKPSKDDGRPQSSAIRPDYMQFKRRGS